MLLAVRSRILDLLSGFRTLLELPSAFSLFIIWWQLLSYYDYLRRISLALASII